MNLFNLTAEAKAVQAMVDEYAAENEGRIPDDLFERLEALDTDIDRKRQQIVWLICESEAFDTAARAEIDRIERRRLSAQNVVKSLRAYLAWSLPAGDKAKLSDGTSLYYMKREKVEPSETADPRLLPDHCKRVKIEADLVAIKEAIKAGEQIDEYSLVETTSLVIRRK